ncbi:flagellar motor protein MotB [Rhodoferax aquaticus]|uniref:Motility protein MotB n=1 Tax=Rhodoferax aquaticus TaxID=2527691 RepID=A0A515EU05_9BURK|nr:flagellar motor protein MotB [Rhodoferax aquaticus]QDL56098.1 motility protein MotB [Rhodoferax aquaticus]
MATDAKKLQPIIIKRVKKGGHSAHGGAWKIAYADFVTAMMAFFLLMWLLGSTSEGDKKGISDYFQSPLKVALQGGSGAGASNSVINGGGNDLTQSAGQSRRGDGADNKARKMSGDTTKADLARKDARTLAALSEKIAAAISSNPKLSEFSSQIKLEITPDGLQIQIVDDQRRPMFDSGSASVKSYMRDILREIGVALLEVDNKISLDGHTDQTTYSNAARGYSNWELSADRANATRRELAAVGMADDKLVRVVGMASSLPLEPDNPLSPSNRRISILVLTKEAELRMLGGNRIPLDAEVETEKPIATTGAKTQP